MNKFATFAVLALAAFALAQSAHVQQTLDDETETQAALTTTDEEETAEVKARGMEVFAPFCTESRDFVYADVKAKTGSGASKSFSWFFSMTENVAKDVLHTNEDATKRLSKQLAQPDAPVDGDDQVAATQRAMNSQSQVMAFANAFATVFRVNADAIVNAVSQKFAAAQEFMDLNHVIEFSRQACQQVEEYEQEMRQQFDEYKAAMPASAQEKYGSARFDSVPCVTTRRISRINGVCRFVNVSFEPIKKVIGY